MKKSFIPLAAALLLGLSACGNTTSTPSSSSVESEITTSQHKAVTVNSVTISNAKALAEDWHFGEADRAIEVSTDPVTNTAQLLRDGDLVFTSSNTAAISIIGKMLHPVGEGTSTITAKVGDKTASIELTIGEALKKPLKIGSVSGVAKIGAGEYFAGIGQTTANKYAFFNGKYSGTYLSTGSWTTAKKVKIEAVDGGFHWKLVDLNKYANVGDNGKLKFDAAASTVWTWNENAKTLVTTVGSDTFYVGTYDSYTTLGTSNINYLFDKGKTTVKAGQFPIQFLAADTPTADPTEFQLEQFVNVVVGTKKSINVVVNPFNGDSSKLTWKSADETIATVDANGVVTGVKPGNVTITASFGDKTDFARITVAEDKNNYGTLEAPLTVEEAIAIGNTIAADQFSNQPLYVKGTMKYEEGHFINNGYNGKYSIATGDKSLYVANSKPVAGVDAYEKDEIIVKGWLTNSTKDKKVEFFKTIDSVYPSIEKIVTDGVNTIEAAKVDHASVTDLSATTGTNRSTFTFKVSVDAGYKVKAVKVNDVSVKADTAGVYTGKVAGKTVIAVEVAADGEKVVIVGDKSIGACILNSTQTKEFTVDGVSFVASGLKTQSAAGADLYGYIMLQGGQIYNTNAFEGYYISSVKVTFTSGTGTSGKPVITLGSSALTTRVTTGGAAPTKGGTLEKTNTDASVKYFNLSNNNTSNVQVASIEITWVQA